MPTAEPRSLARVLARQWVLFTLGLCALLLAGSVLLLFLLEDSFINRRLRDQAAALHATGAPILLPTGFVRHAAADLPADLRTRVGHLRSGRIAELRREDGRYVHVLRGDGADGAPYWLVYDVSDQLTVNAGLRVLAPWLLALCLGVGLLAWLLAGLFVRRSVGRVQALLAGLRGEADPSVLRRRALGETVEEFRQLSLLLADAWDARLAALRDERDTLRFLAHELRTPLQSLKNGLALLPEDAEGDPVLARLRRAAGRLQRASASVLWLGSEADAGRQQCLPASHVRALVNELTPLAAQRAQEITLVIDSEAPWHGPGDALEAVFGNLLLNAIQHGGAGRIAVRVAAAEVLLDNPVPVEAPVGGFGLGLELATRLCERCGWQLRVELSPPRVRHRLSRAATDGNTPPADESVPPRTDLNQGRSAYLG